tara:strand:- start:712 stop:1263 length:552 start_codon:yes stop_codon:yes gene_type:complete
MSKKLNNKKFGDHIKSLIVDKDNLRYIESLKLIMKKIIYILAEEIWHENGYTEKQIKMSKTFIRDYSFVFAVNDLITIQNDNGTFKTMGGVTKWSEDYEENFITFFFKSKEIKANKNNIEERETNYFISSLDKISKIRDDLQLVKKFISIAEKYGIMRRDLISENGYTLALEGRILDSLWSEE